ncbi:hypothetical protein BU17DRAFT_66517 [Hysterangium stoloniferum]|nr:hypothetical protein BU17DRAFT_66517 [Hysterangium stoloniferum]
MGPNQQNGNEPEASTVEKPGVSSAHLADLKKTDALIQRPTILSPDTQARTLPETPEASLMPEKESTGFGKITAPTRPWSPVTLRLWFAASLLSFMLLGAAGLEVALHFSQKDNGWKVSSAASATNGILHYVYTLPPVAVAMIVISLWAWTDVDIKRMQPYIDLAYGNAPAQRSLLLDYSNKHPIIVSFYAYRHSHFVVVLSSLLVLVGLAVQPLAASLFTVKNVWWNGPNLNVTNPSTLGLSSTFNNMTAFSTAAGFVASKVLYGLQSPNFIDRDWAVASMEVPRDAIANGTMFANTTAVQSTANCKAGDTGTITSNATGVGFILAGTSDGCTVNISLLTNASLQYGVDVAICPNAPADPFKPAVFWTLNQASPSDPPQFALIYCRPTIALYNVAAQVALQTGNLINATKTSNSTQPNNITDPNGLMGGRAMNGVAFDLTNATTFAQSRAQVAKTALTAAIVQQASNSDGGLPNQIQTEGLIAITNDIYELYLSLVAKEIYFVPADSILQVATKTFQPRVFLVPLTTHILAGVLVLIALSAGIVHVLHHHARDLVIIPRQPGTIASAAAFTARSNIGDVIDGNIDEKTLIRVLKDRRFRIDKSTGRIMMEGEEGFEYGAAVPIDRRKSVLRLLSGDTQR